ncbi:hypothetical protein GCM10029992_52220 [Glycomyces albus]
MPGRDLVVPDRDRQLDRGRPLPVGRADLGEGLGQVPVDLGRRDRGAAEQVDPLQAGGIEFDLAQKVDRGQLAAAGVDLETADVAGLVEGVERLGVAAPAPESTMIGARKVSTGAPSTRPSSRQVACSAR